ncbi:LOW QUALITY PROTEIN: hypothetical protein PoB_003704400 [Plakobranchus ocellatus]|uniref:Uncharacterized protein n=1 Tax=Plakobranchus ocellatus TaxID=259542 RepID=A0AAV4AVX5_9GAST|nr:LOW QUALITY PROTEIN: hypothetical protein PoB_003704400 [Plakobranchus ocellatus]
MDTDLKMESAPASKSNCQLAETARTPRREKSRDDVHYNGGVTSSDLSGAKPDEADNWSPEKNRLQSQNNPPDWDQMSACLLVQSACPVQKTRRRRAHSTSSLNDQLDNDSRFAAGDIRFNPRSDPVLETASKILDSASGQQRKSYLHVQLSEYDFKSATNISKSKLWFLGQNRNINSRSKLTMSSEALKRGEDKVFVPQMSLSDHDLDKGSLPHAFLTTEYTKTSAQNMEDSKLNFSQNKNQPKFITGSVSQRKPISRQPPNSNQKAKEGIKNRSSEVEKTPKNTSNPLSKNKKPSSQRGRRSKLATKAQSDEFKSVETGDEFEKVSERSENELHDVAQALLPGTSKVFEIREDMLGAHPAAEVSSQSSLHESYQSQKHSSQSLGLKVESIGQGHSGEELPKSALDEPARDAEVKPSEDETFDDITLNSSSLPSQQQTSLTFVSVLSGYEAPTPHPPTDTQSVSRVVTENGGQSQKEQVSSPTITATDYIETQSPAEKPLENGLYVANGGQSKKKQVSSATDYMETQPPAKKPLENGLYVANGGQSEKKQVSSPTITATDYMETQPPAKKPLENGLYVANNGKTNDGKRKIKQGPSPKNKLIDFTETKSPTKKPLESDLYAGSISPTHGKSEQILNKLTAIEAKLKELSLSHCEALLSRKISPSNLLDRSPKREAETSSQNLEKLRMEKRSVHQDNGHKKDLRTSSLSNDLDADSRDSKKPTGRKQEMERTPKHRVTGAKDAEKEVRSDESSTDETNRKNVVSGRVRHSRKRRTILQTVLQSSQGILDFIGRSLKPFDLFARPRNCSSGHDEEPRAGFALTKTSKTRFMSQYHTSISEREASDAPRGSVWASSDTEKVKDSNNTSGRSNGWLSVSTLNPGCDPLCGPDYELLVMATRDLICHSPLRCATDCQCNLVHNALGTSPRTNAFSIRNSVRHGSSSKFTSSPSRGQDSEAMYSPENENISKTRYSYRKNSSLPSSLHSPTSRNSPPTGFGKKELPETKHLRFSKEAEVLIERLQQSNLQPSSSSGKQYFSHDGIPARLSFEAERPFPSESLPGCGRSSLQWIPQRVREDRGSCAVNYVISNTKTRLAFMSGDSPQKSRISSEHSRERKESHVSDPLDLEFSPIEQDVLHFPEGSVDLGYEQRGSSHPGSPATFDSSPPKNEIDSNILDIDKNSPSVFKDTQPSSSSPSRISLTKEQEIEVFFSVDKQSPAASPPRTKAFPPHGKIIQSPRTGDRAVPYRNEGDGSLNNERFHKDDRCQRYPASRSLNLTNLNREHDCTYSETKEEKSDMQYCTNTFSSTQQNVESLSSVKLNDLELWPQPSNHSWRDDNANPHWSTSNMGRRGESNSPLSLDAKRGISERKSLRCEELSHRKNNILLSTKSEQNLSQNQSNSSEHVSAENFKEKQRPALPPSSHAHRNVDEMSPRSANRVVYLSLREKDKSPQARSRASSKRELSCSPHFEPFKNQTFNKIPPAPKKASPAAAKKTPPPPAKKPVKPAQNMPASRSSTKGTKRASTARGKGKAVAGAPAKPEQKPAVPEGVDAVKSDSSQRKQSLRKSDAAAEAVSKLQDASEQSKSDGYKDVDSPEQSDLTSTIVSEARYGPVSDDGEQSILSKSGGGKPRSDLVVTFSTSQSSSRKDFDLDRDVEEEKYYDVSDGSEPLTNGREEKSQTQGSEQEEQLGQSAPRKESSESNLEEEFREFLVSQLGYHQPEKQSKKQSITSDESETKEKSPQRRFSPAGSEGSETKGKSPHRRFSPAESEGSEIKEKLLQGRVSPAGSEGSESKEKLIQKRVSPAGTEGSESKEKLLQKRVSPAGIEGSESKRKSADTKPSSERTKTETKGDRTSATKESKPCPDSSTPGRDRSETKGSKPCAPVCPPPKRTRAVAKGNRVCACLSSSGHDRSEAKVNKPCYDICSRECEKSRRRTTKQGTCLKSPSWDRKETKVNKPCSGFSSCGRDRAKAEEKRTCVALSCQRRARPEAKVNTECSPMRDMREAKANRVCAGLAKVDCSTRRDKTETSVCRTSTDSFSLGHNRTHPQCRPLAEKRYNLGNFQRNEMQETCLPTENLGRVQDFHSCQKYSQGREYKAGLPSRCTADYSVRRCKSNYSSERQNPQPCTGYIPCRLQDISGHPNHTQARRVPQSDSKYDPSNKWCSDLPRSRVCDWVRQYEGNDNVYNQDNDKPARAREFYQAGPKYYREKENGLDVMKKRFGNIDRPCGNLTRAREFYQSDPRNYPACEDRPSKTGGEFHLNIKTIGAGDQTGRNNKEKFSQRREFYQFDPCNYPPSDNCPEPIHGVDPETGSGRASSCENEIARPSRRTSQSKFKKASLYSSPVYHRTPSQDRGGKRARGSIPPCVESPGAPQFWANPNTFKEGECNGKEMNLDEGVLYVDRFCFDDDGYLGNDGYQNLNYGGGQFNNFVNNRKTQVRKRPPGRSNDPDDKMMRTSTESDEGPIPPGVVIFQIAARYCTFGGIRVAGGVRVLMDAPDRMGYVQLISPLGKAFITHYVNTLNFLHSSSAAGVAWSAVVWEEDGKAHRFRAVLETIKAAFSSGDGVLVTPNVPPMPNTGPCHPCVDPCTPAIPPPCCPPPCYDICVDPTSATPAGGVECGPCPVPFPPPHNSTGLTCAPCGPCPPCPPKPCVCPPPFCSNMCASTVAPQCPPSCASPCPMPCPTSCPGQCPPAVNPCPDECDPYAYTNAYGKTLFCQRACLVKLGRDEVWQEMHRGPLMIIQEPNCMGFSLVLVNDCQIALVQHIVEAELNVVCRGNADLSQRYHRLMAAEEDHRGWSDNLKQDLRV